MGGGQSWLGDQFEMCLCVRYRGEVSGRGLGEESGLDMSLGALGTEDGWNSPGVGEIICGAGREEKPLKP